MSICIRKFFSEKTKDKYVWLIVVVGFFSRFLFLPETARFIWDETSDLRRMYEMVHGKFFTMIGPISENGVELFGSLTYYMSLPTTILTGFDPVGPVLANAFFGFLTVILFYIIFKKFLRESAWKFSLALLGWPAFLFSSRWAWNPNFTPFWSTLSILFWLSPSNLNWFLSGLFVGLTIHHHWLGAFTAFSLLLISLIMVVKERKNFSILIFLIFGLLLAVFPFIIFDLRHQFFFFKHFFFTQKHLEIAFFSFPTTGRIFGLIKVVGFTLSVWLIPLTLSFLPKLKMKKRNDNLASYFLLIFLINIFLLIFVTRFWEYYLLPGLPFFITFLAIKSLPVWQKPFLGSSLAFFVCILGFVIYFLTLPPLWQRSMNSAKKIVEIMVEDSRNFENVNVAAIQSPDPNLTGNRYRDMAVIKGAKFLGKDQYPQTQVLYVVSTTDEIEKVCHDPAYEVQNLRPFLIKKSWQIDNFWFIYRLEKQKESVGAC